MIKVILLDVDGVIIKLRKKYFSQKLTQDFGMNLDQEAIQKFFSNEFLLCETGKADLKQELSKALPLWCYPGTVEEIMNFWFEGEAELSLEMVEEIKRLRTKGVKCFICTQNEKYRVEYLWSTVGLKSFLDGIYSTASLGFLKYQAMFWEEIYKTLSSYNKTDILVLDNTPKMVEAAKDFGFNAEVYTTFDEYQKICERYLL